MDNVQTLLENFSILENKSFGEYVKYLISQGYTKQMAEIETKNFFKHSIELITDDMLDKDIHIDIRLKSNGIIEKC